MSSRGTLNILDALENLAIIVESDSLDEIEIDENLQIISHVGEERKEENYWVEARADEQTIEAIKETFKVVHKYLKIFYEKMQKTGDAQRLLEGANTIMVLVGEAAKKLEHFSNLFQKKIVNLREYKDLQNFYRNKVIKETYKNFIKTPPTIKNEEELVSELIGEPYSYETEEVLPSTIYTLDDLNIVKKDTHYELFYLKSEEGKKFYSNELERSIKLACDFGAFTEEYFGDDPLLQIKNWEDKALQLCAKSILEKNHLLIEAYFKEAMAMKGMEMIAILNKALMALMLAANPRNLIRQFALKSSHRYFFDFQYFLRELLVNSEYQKLMIYSVPESKPFFHKVLDIVQVLCEGVYLLDGVKEETIQLINAIVLREDPTLFDIKPFSKFLKASYEAYDKGLKKHPSGPLFKALDIIREEEPIFFDPITQGNLPGVEYTLRWDEESEIKFLRMPSPIRQEFIDRVEILEEFKGLLRSFTQRSGCKHLVFNFQDRTSWKEHARSIAIEGLQKNAEFAKTLFVVTLPKDTDFYWQTGEYEFLENASLFIEQLFIHLQDEATGFYFPPLVRKILFPEFMNEILGFIYNKVFANKDTLSYIERLNFIEWTYLFIELKLIDELKPEIFSCLSKDGLDVGCPEAIAIQAFLKHVQGKEWTHSEKENALQLLFAPTLIARERAPLQERFSRFLDEIESLEETPLLYKDLTHLFPNGIINCY